MSRVGILALDPGSTSGVDCGVWSLSGSVGDALLGYRGEVSELRGTLDDQAQIVARMWVRLCESNPELRCYLVIESFQLGPTRHVLQEHVLDPIRLSYLTIGYLRGAGVRIEVMWQTPAAAKSHATDARLREWGAWVRGSDHKRDARRHAITLRNRLASR